MRTVIFDLDGTLADTAGDLIAAANACFRDLDLGDLLTEADAGTALRGARAMLLLGFARADGFAEDPQEAASREYHRLVEYYREAICVRSRLYDGAHEAVERLRGAGYRTGICTNKPEGLTESLLAALGVRSLFDSVVGADTLPVRKPDPLALVAAVERAGGELRRACLVGDSDTDRATARAAGVPSVLMTMGPDGAALAALEPEVLIASHGELFDAVEALNL